MKKTKQAIFVIAGCMLLIILAICSFTIKSKVYAINSEDGAYMDKINSAGQDEDVTPYALASLSLSIKGGENKVIATVKNDFTLFPSTVNVIVQLFYSTSYCEDYNQMTLASMNSTEDLDMGKTITTEASTDGQERFWMARMRYREGSGTWKERTASARYSADGTYMGIS